MGGKEAIRGFLYQGFASVLEALTQDYWDKIYVEYPTGDKIDIALESNGCLTKVIQVKSSINLFSKNDIVNWINELVKETISEEYSVFLIGACDEETNTFINALSYYKSGMVLPKKSKKSLEGFDATIFNKHNITITVLPFNELILQSITRDRLHKYLSFKGFRLDYEYLELISESVLATQMLLGTKGKSISKIDFDKKIFSWVDLTSGNMLKGVSQHAKLELVFYNQETNKYSPTMSECNITEYYSYKKYLQDYKDDCINLIKAIDSITLPTHDVVESKEIVKDKTTIRNEINIESISLSSSDVLKKFKPHDCSDLIPNIRNFLTNYAEIPDTEKEESIRDIKELFNIDIKKDFFYVGNLRKEMKFGPFGKKSYNYSGSESEEQKHYLIADLQYKIYLYKKIIEFINNISMCCILPVAIQNTSDNPDKNITIKLYIDKSSVRLFEGKQYPESDFIQYMAESFCKEDGIISGIFGYKADSNINIELKNQKKFQVTNPNNIYDFTSEDFYDGLNTYIAQNTYDDKDFYIVELKLEDDLRPKELKFLNKVILFHSLKSDVHIKYKILSSNTDGLNEGILTIKKSAK